MERSRPVAVLVGVGNVGFPLAQLLVLAGMDLVIVDRGTVRERNLQRQLHRKRDVERPKAAAAARRLRNLRPDASVVALDCDCRNLGLGFWISVPDVVFGAVDSLGAEGWLGAACLLAGVTFVRPATTGDEGGCGSASVRYFPADGGVCPRCSWSSSVYDSAGTHMSCDGLEERNAFAGAFQTTEDGYLAASLAMKAYRRGATFAHETQVLGPPDKMEVRTSLLTRADSCNWRHERLELVEHAQRAPLKKLFKQAAHRLRIPPERLVLETYLQPVSEQRWCIKCKAIHPPAFLVFPVGAEQCTPPCDGQLKAETTDRLDRDKVPGLLDRAAGPLGMPAGWAGIFGNGRQELLLATPFRKRHLPKKESTERITTEVTGNEQADSK